MHYTIKLKYLDTNFEIMSTSGQIQEQWKVSMGCFIGALPLIKWRQVQPVTWFPKSHSIHKMEETLCLEVVHFPLPPFCDLSTHISLSCFVDSWK